MLFIAYDVFGFYLQNVDNIYDIPDVLYTEKIWRVVRTDVYVNDEDYNFDNCYKRLVTSSVGKKIIDHLIIIDKDTYKVISKRGSSDNEGLIAEYLWIACDELPVDYWEEVQKKNDGYGYKEIYFL